MAWRVETGMLGLIGPFLGGAPRFLQLSTADQDKSPSQPFGFSYVSDKVRPKACQGNCLNAHLLQFLLTDEPLMNRRVAALSAMTDLCRFFLS